MHFRRFAGAIVLTLLATTAHASEAYPPITVQRPDGSQAVLKYKPTARWQPEQRCQNYNGPYTVYGGRLTAQEYTIAYGPYSTNCTGTHQFGFTSANVPGRIELQRLMGSEWVYVGDSSYGDLNAYGQPAGTYRVRVLPHQTIDSWALNVTTPGY